MSNDNFDPVVDSNWLDADTRKALDGIGDPTDVKQHVAKKRATVIRVAFQMSIGEAVAKAFLFKDACAENNWHGKTRPNGRRKPGWKELPEIDAALRACVKRLIEWRDEETTRVQARYKSRMLQAIAEYASDAPAAIAAVMADPDQRGVDRTNAAMKLIGLVLEPTGQSGVFTPVGSGGGDITQTVNVGDDFIDNAIESELARRLASIAPAGQTADAAPAGETVVSG